MAGPSTKIIPDDRTQEEPLILSRLKRAERVEHFETKRRTKTGEIIDISLTISPVKNTRGEIVGVSKIARNITDRRRAEHHIRESEERFRMAVLSTGLGTWEYVPATGYLNWSKECRDIYGIPNDFEIDFNFFTKSIYHEDTEDTLNAIHYALDPESEGKYDVKFRILRYDTKKIRWIRSQGKVFFNEYSQPERFIGTVLDITDHMTSNAELEHQIQLRTTELENLNKRLLASNQELEQFAYVASHDLQEPLRKINAFGDMLSTRMGDAIPVEGQDLIRRMQSASTRMKSLIDSLLSYSLLSSDATKSEIVDLNKTVIEVFDDIETSLKAKEGKIK